MNIKFLIPAYNEEENILQLLELIEKYSLDHNYLNISVTVCDDGSTDQTLNKLNSFQGKIKLNILNNRPNSGLTFTLNKLINTITPDENNDYIVIMDGDGSHLPEDLTNMIKLIHENDLVISSRFQTGAIVKGVSSDRLLYSKVLSIIYRLVFRLKNVKDYSCGYRIYRTNILLKLKEQFGENILTMKSFACSMELLLKASSLGIRVAEAPITLRYDLKKSKSKMPVMKTIFDSIKLIYLLKRDQ